MQRFVKALRQIFGFSVVILAVSLGSPGRAEADIIVLTNGSEIRGKILSRTDKKVVIEVAYGNMTIAAARIQEVRSEDQDVYLRKTGERLLVARDYDKALDFLRKACDQNPESTSCKKALVDGLLRAAGSAFAQRHYRDLGELVEETRTLDPKNPRLEQIVAKLTALQAKRAEVELEARQAVETQDLDGAFTAYAWLYESFPEDRGKWRQNLARLNLSRGHLAFEERALDRARELYHEALGLDPDLIAHAQEPLVFVEIQRVIPLLERGEFAAARKQLSEAQDLLPDNPALLYHLALATEGSGDLTGAAELYAQLAGEGNESIDGAAQLARLRTLAESRLAQTPEDAAKLHRPRWKDTDGKAGQRTTRHFVVHHRNEAQATEVVRYLEHHFEQLQRSWFAGGSFPPLRHKVAVHLHPSRATYLQASNAPPWSDGVARTNRRYGLLVGQELHFDTSAPQFLAATVPHELAHIVLPHLMGSEAHLPLWIDEGIAASEEPAFKQHYYNRIVSEAMSEGVLIPLQTLSKLSGYPAEAQIPLFYAQSRAVVAYLRDRYGTRDAMALLRDIALRPDKVFDGSPFASIADLDRSWQRWFKRAR